MAAVVSAYVTTNFRSIQTVKVKIASKFDLYKVVKWDIHKVEHDLAHSG